MIYLSTNQQFTRGNQKLIIARETVIRERSLRGKIIAKVKINRHLQFPGFLRVYCQF